MRIVHVIGSMHPRTGGPPVVMTRLAAALATLEHDVHIIAHDDAALRPEIDALLAGVPGMDRVEIELMPPPGSRIDSIRRPMTAHRVAELAGEHAFVHLHGVWEPALHAAARAARATRTPHALTPHGMLTPYSLRSKRWKKRLALALGARSTLRHAAFLHALNPHEADELRSLAFGPPAEVLPNGIFLEELEPRPAPGTFRGEHPELGDDPYVLFLARLHQIKGIDVLIDGFARLAERMPGVRLVVAGPDEGYREACVAAVASAGLANRVHLTGPIYGPAKRAALVDAAAFCLPSRHEGFSIAITEALAFGLPVVISDRCNFDAVAEVGAGVIVPLEGEAVAAALAGVLGDAGRAAAMGKAGRRLIAERFTWPVIARRLAETYARYSRPRSDGA